MAHVRKQIRDYLKTQLLGSAEAGDRVHAGRRLPFAKSEGDAINIFTPASTVDDETQGGGQLREISIRIDLSAKAADATTDDRIDALSVHVEKKVFEDETLGGIALATSLRSFDVDVDVSGEKSRAVGSLLFIALVRTNQSDPETVIT